MNLLDRLRKSAEFIRENTRYRPEIGIILGSGLGPFADSVESPQHFPYADIPGFPVSTVEGHAGTLVLGRVGGKTVVAMKGRIHYYEGYSMEEVTFPVRVMRLLGVEDLIVTSACGAINSRFRPGSLVAVSDHINLMGDNPLIGKNFDELGPRFPDMSAAYDAGLIRIAQSAAAALDIELHHGIHASVSGPYFLSRAELGMVQLIGADTIGMSMIPEVIAGVHGGIRCLGIACVTDMAMPDQESPPLTHEEVMEVAQATQPTFSALLSSIISKM